MSSTNPPLFEFLLFDGFSNMVLASAMEPLRDVNMRSAKEAVRWHISTVNGDPVTSSSGLQISPDHAFEAQGAKRTLVIVSGYQVREHLTPSLLAQLRSSVRHCDVILGLDTASWLLASGGLLDGHKATIHWQELNAFEEAFPRVKTSRSRFVRSGPFLTCGGASTALDLMLHLIRELFGPAAAFDASTMFVYNPSSQAETKRGDGKLKHIVSPMVLAATDLMADNIEVSLTTFELAKRVSISEPTLRRAFLRDLKMTPGKYYQFLRLQRARYLADETNLTPEQIAFRCGFSSASSLGRSFSDAFGISIYKMRNSRYT